MNFRSRSFLEESYNPAAAQKGYAKFDARVGVKEVDGRWELALVGKNLTNETTASHAFATPFAPAIVSKFFDAPRRSEEHTYELQSLMRNSYAVFCLKKKK